MKPPPRISEAEWEVMRLFWPRRRLTAPEVLHLLKHRTAWRPATVKTLLNRLLRKGALGYTRQGRGYRYHPRLQEAQCLRVETDSFLARFFDGALAPMLAHFVHERKLTARELQELRRLLDPK